MRYRDSLWDDSEPDYAPGIKKIRSHYIWRPSKKYLDAGYSIKTYRLEGAVGDGLDLERARQCRVLTREMVKWYEGATQGREEGTWGWLIGRYLHDEFSPFHDAQISTQTVYRQWMSRIEDGIGSVLLSETDYTRLMMWQRTMRDNGRSVDYISKWFRHWGLALSHGVRLGNRDCIRIKEIRSAMRIQSAPARSTTITREQIEAIVAEADKRGWQYLSLSTLFRFEFLLRGTDVYGEWVRSEDQQGGVQHNGQIWIKGLTWEMFSPDLFSFTKVISKTAKSLPEPYTFDLSFTKVISKTAKSLPEPYTFDLTHTPDIQRRLMEVPREKRVGPVIVLDHGRPPKAGVISRAFKKIVRDLKMPDTLRISDARSGGITEAKAMVDPMTLRDAAQHTQTSTTDRYVRNRSDSANKVVELRRGRK